MRNAVKALRLQMSVSPHADIPLVYDPGDAIQIDWGEATAYIDGCKPRFASSAEDSVTVVPYLSRLSIRRTRNLFLKLSKRCLISLAVSQSALYLITQKSP